MLGFKFADGFPGASLELNGGDDHSLRVRQRFLETAELEWSGRWKPEDLAATIFSWVRVRGDSLISTQTTRDA